MYRRDWKKESTHQPYAINEDEEVLQTNLITCGDGCICVVLAAKIFG